MPDNPKVAKGVRIIYIGAGRREITGAGSSLHYVVSDHRRSIKVDPRDVDALLRERGFMLEP